MANALQPALPFEPVRAVVPPIRRRVFRLRLAPDGSGTYLFRARSFSRRAGRPYRVRVNPRTGYVDCNCPDFRYRHAIHAPTFFGGQVCKHLRRAMRTVRGLSGR